MGSICVSGKDIRYTGLLVFCSWVCVHFGKRVGRYVHVDGRVKGKGWRVPLHPYIDVLVEAKGGSHIASSYSTPYCFLDSTSPRTFCSLVLLGWQPGTASHPRTLLFETPPLHPLALGLWYSTSRTGFLQECWVYKPSSSSLLT